MTSFRKPLDALTPADIQTMIRDAWPESDELELKRCIPTKNGAPDSWYADQNGIGDYGRNQLLSEVVGFANSYGGDLVIGIEESANKPPRACQLRPLPQAAELAHRLELAARDCIEPTTPLLQARGITVTEDGAGIVIVRMPRSRTAPHRLRPTLQCYRRTRDRTETMTMREIQDLTFSVARGLQGVEERLATLRQQFQNDCELSRIPDATLRLGINVRGVPAAADLALERVHRVERIAPSAQHFELRFAGERVYPISFLHSLGPFRPILRGTRAENRTATFLSIAELHCDGSIGYTYCFDNPAEATEHGQRQHVLFPSWLLSLVLNCAATADRFREFVGAGNVEYAIEVEILSTPDGVTTVDLSARYALNPLGQFPAGSTLLPRYSLGLAETRLDLLNLIWSDYWNAIGVDVQTHAISAIT